MVPPLAQLPATAVLKWKEQFSPKDQWVAERLLKNFRYYDADTLIYLLQQLHNSLFDEFSEHSTRVLFVPSGYVASSGAAVSYLYRRANTLPERQFISAADLGNTNQNPDLVVFLDDFIGSGHSAVRLWEEIARPFQDRTGAQLVFACAVGFETAIQFIQAKTSFRVICADIVTQADLPFTENSRIFPEAIEREKALDIISRYSNELTSFGPLGFENGQALISFFFNTPDNTLPIFWSTANGWEPLFSFGTTVEDSTNSFRSGRGPTLPTVVHSSQQSINELKAFDESDIDPDSAIEILQECQSVRALSALAPVISTLGIQSDKLKSLINLIKKLRHAVHEQQSVQTALVIASRAHFTANKAKPFVVASSPINVSSSSEIESLAELVNGFSGAVALFPDGLVYGNIMYEQPKYDLPNPVPKRWEYAAATSHLLNALVIIFSGDGRVAMLFDGKRLLTYRQATWHVTPANLAFTLKEIEEERQIDQGILMAVYHIALDMSDMGYGAIFLIGDESQLTNLVDAQISCFEWQQIKIKSGYHPQMISIAKQDGATLISKDGTMLRNGLMLRPPADAPAEIEPGDGARHSSAVKTTAVSSSIALVVSADGKITLYAGGKKVLKDIV